MPTSPSTRRAWIEILFDEGIYNAFGVALHPEGVDRNAVFGSRYELWDGVALYPEGVDRNEMYLAT